MHSGKKVSNHSARKTSISRLLDAGVPENFVTKLSGHKNLQSLSTYKSASLKQQRQISDTLSRTPTAFPLSHSTSTNVRQEISSVTTQSSLSIPSSRIQETEQHTFFARVTIGSITNCVFKVFQSGSDSSTAGTTAKRPRVDHHELFQ